MPALSRAWEMYSHMEDASISLQIVMKPLTDWKWADPKWKPDKQGARHDGRVLLHAFSCIVNLETGGVDIAPSKFTDVMAISSGDSIYVSSHLLCDPAERPKSVVQRLVGNVGEPGLTLLVPPKDCSKAAAISDSHKTSGNPVLSYVSLMGVRQLATGIILLTFAYQKKWTEMATILTILGVVVAGIDGFYLSRCGARNLARFHAIPGALIALLAFAVILTNT